MASATSKYGTVIHWAKAQFASRAFAPGDRFYSEKELSTRFGLSRQTIRHALDILEAEGYLRRVRGSGTYVAESAAEALPKTMNVGIISTYLDDYIFPSIIRGIETQLTRHGYAMQFAFTHNKVENESRALLSMLEKGVDGLIVEPTKSGLPCPNLDIYHRIRSAGIPLVFFNAHYPALPCPYVALDDEAVGAEATRLLLDAGHTRIAGFFQLDDLQGHNRYLGYLQTLKQFGLGIRDENVLWYATEDLPGLFQQPDRLLARLEDCTALLCYNDQLAIRILELWRQLGKRVPEELSIIGVDNCDMAAMCTPPLTSVSHPKEELGSAAAAALLSLIDGNPAETVLFPPRVIQRESVLRIKAIK